jgi:hypothetical protein
MQRRVVFRQTTLKETKTFGTIHSVKLVGPSGVISHFSRDEILFLPLRRNM